MRRRAEPKNNDVQNLTHRARSKGEMEVKERREL